MTGSYRADCESCEESISAAYRFCPWCGVEQQRAVEAIRRMRDDPGGTTVQVDIQTEHWSTIMEDLHRDLGDPLESISTQSHGDRIGRRVSVSGALTIEDIGPGREERRRQRRIEQREEAINRHAVAEGADR